MSVIQILRRVFRVNYFGLISVLVLLTKVFTTACLKRKKIMVYHHFITDVCCLVVYFVVNCIVIMVLNMQGANI